MRNSLIINMLVFGATAFAAEQITPYKFTDQDQTLPAYIIPESSRFTAKRSNLSDPEIVYYVSIPKKDNFPIAILCGGSSSKNDISSIIHVHRYFLQEFLDLGAAVLTVEQRGVDGNKIDPQEFMNHYTRTERLNDHNAVIQQLKAKPPEGWNGKLVFLGVSEGGPLVTSLTTEHSDITLATMNWAGAKAWSWQDELWLFIESIRPELETHAEFSADIASRSNYNNKMKEILSNPSANKYFLNMTYKYHADALTYPLPDYQKIRTPFLVVTGIKDTIIQSSDQFTEAAKKAGVEITYLRVEDMGHVVRKRTDITAQSFDWLRNQLEVAQNKNRLNGK